MACGSFPTEPVTSEAHPYSFQVVGLCGQRVWAQSTHRFTVCEHDRAVRRILNVMVQGVAFLLPLFGVFGRMSATWRALGSLLASAMRRQQPKSSRSGCDGQLGRPNRAQKLCSARRRGFAGGFERFEVLVPFSACSCCEDVVQSGGNTRLSSFFAYLTKVRESMRLPALHLVRSRTIAELGLHHQQCNLFFLFTSGRVIDIPCEAMARSREAESSQARY
ncbi:hypothetical protein Taro_013344 [Colocasia esculenta]|uniref:Uncharacterized protein n=1 Tax=Colocasia esculenta TaxID=4460 RepID=A0A843UBR9_COLES|nr:hypothetical protein [Colocasia esculenta]